MRAFASPVSTDGSVGDVRVMRLADHPFYVLTLFVPQTSSTAATPHPVVTSYLRAAVAPQRRSASPLH